ncbi:7465_t:CDS:2, partial [Racocetra persica]
KCSKCGTKRPKEMFIWNSIRYLICIKCKERHGRRKKKNQSSLTKTTNPTNVESVAQFSTNTESITQPETNNQEIEYVDNNAYVEINCLELTASVSTNEVADIDYQIHLLVNINIDDQNMIAKEIAKLVIIEIEEEDNYIW